MYEFEWHVEARQFLLHLHRRMSVRQLLRFKLKTGGTALTDQYLFLFLLVPVKYLTRL